MPEEKSMPRAKNATQDTANTADLTADANAVDAAAATTTTTGTTSEPQTFADIDAKRLPFVVRLFGILAIIGSVATIPVIVGACIYAIREIVLGHEQVNALDLSFILSTLQVVVLFAEAVMMLVFGILLIRNHRRYAARWAYVLMAIDIVGGLLTFALEGLKPALLSSVIILVLLICISIVADPGLSEERRLQWALWRMNDHDEYESARAAGTLGRDPSNKGYIALNFFNLFWIFVIASFGGLILETIWHLIMFHEFQNRTGMLFGPFSPIYGWGCVIATILLNRLWNANAGLIFCASALIGGTFEYITSWFLEVAFGITAWDYTGQWLSIDGRTCGQFMFYWGILGIFWIKFLLPRILALINLIPWQIRYTLTVAFAVFIIVDFVMGVIALDCWYGRMAGIPQDTPIAQFFAKYFDNDYMANHYQTMTIDPSKAGRI